MKLESVKRVGSAVDGSELLWEVAADFDYDLQIQLRMSDDDFANLLREYRSREKSATEIAVRYQSVGWPEDQIAAQLKMMGSRRVQMARVRNSGLAWTAKKTTAETGCCQALPQMQTRLLAKRIARSWCVDEELHLDGQPRGGADRRCCLL